ncbi:ISAs1 family transposase [Zavarzinella formosa]|uniref:ISAs1 family transposase n=1 Tax=Zavarzinella formosa TaxID=360055 RepID=UPI0002D4332E|nr:ISAs1 family transposase [Zavarzinella formosa]
MADTPRPLADCFSELPGPRVRLKCVHEFMDIILIVVVATIGVSDDFAGVVEFARAREVWFHDRLGLRLDHGIPSHDPLNLVFALINPAQFQRCLIGWAEAMSDRLKLRQIPIDGKAMRGSKRKTSAGDRTVQIVSAWASANGVTPARGRTGEKSNEITAIPELLKLPDVSKALEGIDAAGCQKAIASQIVSGGGDRPSAVKENQPRLYEDIMTLLAVDEADEAGLSYWMTQEKSRGREEFRSCFVLTNLEGIRDREFWKGLKSVVCVTSGRRAKGKMESSEVRYYISSRRGSGKMFLGTSRKHWSIEYERHWILDVAFREDDRRLREGHAPENMSAVRKMALAMLKKATTCIGIKNKRLKAGWDTSFLEHVLHDFLGK